MATDITITEKHLSYTREQVLLELETFKKTARDYDEVEQWVAKRLPVFGGIPLQLGDEVQMKFHPFKNDLARMISSEMHCAVETLVQRKIPTVSDLGKSMTLYSEGTISKLEHQFSIFMPIMEWPLVIAGLVVHHRSMYNFKGPAHAMATASAFMNPYLQEHFPGLSYETLQDLAAVDLLPEGRELVDFLFNSRDKGPGPTVPSDLSM